MARVKSGLWVSAFVRRVCEWGDLCVVARRGDPDAGQVWIEIDHLDGTNSLYAPAPINQDAVDREFVLRLSQVDSAALNQRLRREEQFDPDFWHICLQTRRVDFGLTVISGTV